MSTSGREKLMWGVCNAVIIVCALVPVLWIASLSFKTPGTLTDGNFIPREWTLDNYRTIFSTNQFVRALVNSIGIALIATVIAVVLGTMAAYAVARLDFPGKKALVGVPRPNLILQVDRSLQASTYLHLTPPSWRSRFWC